MMRNLNAERAGSDVHLWSSGPSSMGADYHKIRGSVKKGGPTAISWDRGKTDGTEQMTIVKLAYHFTGSLGNNDEGTWPAPGFCTSF